MSLRSYLYFAFKIKDGLFIGDINSPNVLINFNLRKKSFLIQIKLPILLIVQQVKLNLLKLILHNLSLSHLIGKIMMNK